MAHYLAPRPEVLDKYTAFLDLAQLRLASGKQCSAILLIPADPAAPIGIEITSGTSASDIVNALNSLTAYCPSVKTVLVDDSAYWRSQLFVSAALNRRICLTYMPSPSSGRSVEVEKFLHSYKTEVLECLPSTTITIARQATRAWLAQRH